MITTLTTIIGARHGYTTCLIKGMKRATQTTSFPSIYCPVASFTLIYVK